MRFGLPALCAAVALFVPHAASPQGALPSARYQPPPPTPLDEEIGRRFAGTISLDITETRVGGELRGCNLVYVAASRDFTYRQGGAVAVSGSLQVGWSPPHHLYWAIKVVPQDLLIERDGSLARRTFTPSLAWMQAGRFTTVGRVPNPFMCEAGGFCGAGNEGLIELLEAIVPGRFRLGIQRWAGGQDLIMPLDLGVGPNGQDTSTAFGQCLLNLLHEAERAG